MLELKNVSKIYNDSKVALQNINLKLNDTGFILINGKSGSGKTTLLNLIGNIILPSKGEVTYNNKNISDIKKYTYKYISYIFQDYNLFSSLNVLENIQFLNKNANKELIKNFQIEDILNKKVNEISGGEARRVAVIRSIINNSKIVLCDEPTASLDLDNEKKVLELLKEKNKNSLVIVVSHHLDVIKPYADRIITLENGNVIEDKIISNEEKLISQDKLVKKRKSLIYLTFKRIKENKSIFILNTLILMFLFFLYILSLNFKNIDFNKMEIDLMKDNNFHKFYSEVNNEYFNKVYEVYDDANLMSFSVGSGEYNIYYKNDFNNVGYTEYDDNYDSNLLGNKPINKNELVINEYLFECFNKFGIESKDKIYIYPKNIEDVIGLEILINNEIYKITGVLKEDLNRYSSLKNLTNSQGMEKLVNIFEDDIIRSNFVYVNNSFFNDKDINLISYFFYSNDYKELLKIKNNYRNIESSVTSVMEENYNILNTLKLISKYSFYIIIVILIIYLLITNMNSISNYEKENKILYFMGFSKFKITNIYFLDIFTKVFWASILGIVFMFCFDELLNYIMTINNHITFNLLKVDFNLLLFVSLLNFFIVILSYISSLVIIHKNIKCE